MHMTMNNSFTFLHTADWHIGNPFSRFDREMRQKLNHAIFRAVELTFIYARKKNIPLLLCAGDAVDNGQTCAREDLLKLFGIIHKYPGVQVVIIAGNHDPLVTRNIYQRVEKSSYPENLHLVTGDEVLDYPQWNLKIFASSAREKNGRYNPLEWLTTETVDRAAINVGLCHGSIENDTFSTAAFPIPADFARQRGLDYLALGDWHSFKKINQQTYYPGVPEPLQFGDEGRPLEVTIHGPGQVPRVEPVTTVRQYQWRQEKIEITEGSLDEFKDHLQVVKDKEICKFDISGRLPIQKYKVYKELLEINRRTNCEILDNVTIHPGDQDLPEAASGFMAAIVQRLLELKKTGEPLPIDINPYAPITRTNVHHQAETLSSEEIIDRALLKIYSYAKEKE
jgi:DNA repair exonuclease SbcCD nuclease subunit